MAEKVEFSSKQMLDWMGYIADMFHSLQLSFLVSMLCFVYVGVYFWRESKVRTALAEVTAS